MSRVRRSVPDDAISLREYVERIVDLRVTTEREAREAYIKAHGEMAAEAKRELARRLDWLNHAREQIAAEQGNFISRDVFDGFVNEYRTRHEQLRTDAEEGTERAREYVDEKFKSLTAQIRWIIGLIATLVVAYFSQIRVGH